MEWRWNRGGEFPFDAYVNSEMAFGLTALGKAVNDRVLPTNSIQWQAAASNKQSSKQGCVMSRPPWRN
jgi:hypothetical protein